jgi:hypothetical protein
MDSKEDLVKHIRTWIQIDNKIAELQKTIKNYKTEKKDLTESLVNIMKSNELDCIDINNGKLIYSKTKTKKAISKKVLLDSLKLYFKEDIDLAQEVSEHILNNREETIKENIRRKTEK